MCLAGNPLCPTRPQFSREEITEFSLHLVAASSSWSGRGAGVLFSHPQLLFQKSVYVWILFSEDFLVILLIDKKKTLFLFDSLELRVFIGFLSFSHSFSLFPITDWAALWNTIGIFLKLLTDGELLFRELSDKWLWMCVCGGGHSCRGVLRTKCIPTSQHLTQCLAHGKWSTTAFDWISERIAGTLLWYDSRAWDFVVAVQPLCHVRLFATPWTAARQASLSFTISWSWLMSIESMMPSNHLVLCHLLLHSWSQGWSQRGIQGKMTLCPRTRNSGVGQESVMKRQFRGL